MSKNVKINGTTYSGVSSVSLPLADGSGNVLYRENSEVINTPTASLSVTVNGTYNVTNYASAVVSVASSSSVTLQEKSVTPSTSAQTVTADSGYAGLSSVTVAAIQTQAKSVTPSTSVQTVTADSGKYLSQVTVAAVSGSPALTSLSVTPTTMTVASGSTSDAVKSGLTAMSGTYTLSGYTGTLSADLTAYISSATVSGTMPTAGNTAAMTVSYGGKSVVVSVTMQAAASTEPKVTVTQSGTGYSIEELNGATSGTVEAKGGFLELVINITSGYTSDGTFTITKNGETLTSGVTISGDDSSGYALSISGLSDGNSITVALTTTKATTTGDTVAYAWATVAAYASLSTLPKTGALALKKTVCNSADEYSAAAASDIDLSDTSKTVTITIDGTLYDADGAVSTIDGGGLLNAQITRTNGVWAMNWMDFQDGGTQHTTFSTSDPTNVTISDSGIAIYAGKRIWNGNEYAMKFTTNQSGYRVDYKITVAIS